MIGISYKSNICQKTSQEVRAILLCENVVVKTTKVKTKRFKKG
jgi:hypothetical protein